MNSNETDEQKAARKKAAAAEREAKRKAAQERERKITALAYQKLQDESAKWPSRGWGEYVAEATKEVDAPAPAAVPASDVAAPAGDAGARTAPGGPGRKRAEKTSPDANPTDPENNTATN